MVKYKKLCLLIVTLFCSIGALYAWKKNPQYEFTRVIVPAYLPASVNGINISSDPRALQHGGALEQFITVTLNKLNSERMADGSGYPKISLADTSTHDLLTLSARSEKIKMTIVRDRMQEVLAQINAYQSPVIDLVHEQTNLAIQTNQKHAENIRHDQKQLQNVADYSTK